MKFRCKPISVLLLAVFLLLSAGFVKNSDLFFQIKKQLTIFSDVFKEVSTQYVDEIEPETLIKYSIDSMLEVLDPYTVFIDEGEQQQMEILSSGSYGGIGVETGFSGNQIVVIAPQDGYPAQRAGIRPGDIIEQINGTDITGSTPEEIQRLTIGDIGTSIELVIRRPGIEQPIIFTLEREQIEVKNITYSGRIGPYEGIGYIQLARFGQKTSEEIRQVLLQMHEEETLQGLILDLRNNPGGLLNEAVELVDKFVEPGITVVETRGRTDSQHNAFVTDEPALFEDMPVVLLMNNGSASASEVVAGALQDLDRAVILGENSFGKGLVQTITPLSYNTSLKMTVSKYYTPSGRSIQSIDYSDRTGGDLITDADSLRRKFYTRNGRSVFDGKGIQPDITIEEDGSNLMQLALQKENEFFLFINGKLREYEDPPEEMPDRYFDEFASYLVQKKFNYETPVDRQLNQMEANINSFSSPSAAERNLEELKALLRDFKISQVYENQPFIEKELQLEWIAQTAGKNQRNRQMIDFDKTVQQAAELLNDMEAYHDILEP